MIDTKEEQIKLLCKQLKLPTFANYADILRQSQPGADFSDLLLELLMAETAARQENQNRLFSFRNWRPVNSLMTGKILS